MLFIGNDDVQKVLKMDECIRTQEEAFRGLLTRESVHRTRIDVYVPTDLEPEGYYRWGTMEGSSKSLGVHAIRMKSDVITWPRDAQGNWTEDKYCVRPGTYCGLIFLLSTRTGEPLAIINDGYLQHMRVAAGAGIGVKYLAREDARVVGMLGSGGMARTYLEAFQTVRPIDKVKVYSPTRQNREAYAEEMSEKLGLEVVAVNSAREAVAGVDIVSTCTDSMEPTFKGEWLEPGMHVTNLGSHELDEEVFRRATFVLKQGVSGVTLSDPEQRVEMGRGHSPIAYIAGTDEEVKRLPEPAQTRQFETPGLGANLPKFTDLAAGRVQGRQSRDDVTVYLAVGYQGLQFAAAGAVVYQRAREQGLGREVPTDWFLQDIRD